jgi:hypothetical protein
MFVNAELEAISACREKYFDVRIRGLKKDTKSRVDVTIVSLDIRSCYFQNKVR